MAPETEEKSGLSFIIVGLALVVFFIVVMVPQSFWVNLSLKFFP